MSSVVGCRARRTGHDPRRPRKGRCTDGRQPGPHEDSQQSDSTRKLAARLVLCAPRDLLGHSVKPSRRRMEPVGVHGPCDAANLEPLVGSTPRRGIGARRASIRRTMCMIACKDFAFLPQQIVPGRHDPSGPQWHKAVNPDSRCEGLASVGG